MKVMNAKQLYRAIAASLVVMAATTLAQAKINIENLGVHPKQPYYERMLDKYTLNCEVDFKNKDDSIVVVTEFTHKTDLSSTSYSHSVQDFWQYAKLIYAGTIIPGAAWLPQYIPSGARIVFMWPYTDFKAPLPQTIYLTLTFKNVATNEVQSMTFEINPVEYKLNVSRDGYPNSYIFPLQAEKDGFEWYIAQGHELDRVHHRQVMTFGNGGTPLFNQRYAHDIVMRSQSTGKYAQEGSENSKEAYFIWGKNVVAAASGYACIVKNDEEDIEIGEDYKGDWPGGNRVVINHMNWQSSVYFHLKKGSITVKEGDWVNKGDVIGQVGNSGNTSGPHLHFQIQPQSPLAPCATDKVENLPIYFQNIFVRPAFFPWITVKWDGALATGDAVIVP